jgi:hypothetical protein
MAYVEFPIKPKTTAKGEILRRLREAGKPLAVHEFAIVGYSENCLATRCPEMAKDGIIVGIVRPGKNFKEWSIQGVGSSQT